MSKEFEQGFESVLKTIFNIAKEMSKDDSYQKFMYDEFKDGEHVVHKKEEYKDGKCVCNEGFDKTKTIENETCSCCKDKDNKELDELRTRIKVLESENHDLKEIIKKHENKMKAIQSIMG